MNESFNTYLIDILEKTENFMEKEIPVIAEQILKMSLIELIASIMLYLALIYVTCKALKWAHIGVKDFTCSADREFVKWASYVTAAVIIAPCVAIIVNEVLLIIKIYVAPKLFLLEYASGLIK